MLVTDLTHFTSFSDITEPEYVFETLREYHRLIGGIVEGHGGEIFDLAGDGVFALFNASIDTSDASQRAVQTALGIHDQARDLIARWRKQGQHLGLRIALNAGYASLGDVRAGSFSRRAAVGTAVYATFHLGRLAGTGEILATQRIADAAEGLADVIERPEITLTALTRTLKVFELRPRPD